MKFSWKDIEKNTWKHTHKKNTLTSYERWWASALSDCKVTRRKMFIQACRYIFDNILLVSLAKTTLLTPRFDFGWHIPSFGSLLVEDNWHPLKSLCFTLTFPIDLPQINFFKETKSLKWAANVEKRSIALGITFHEDVLRASSRVPTPRTRQ